MKVQYDHQIFEMQVYGGISRYFFELINYYHTERTLEPGLSLVCSNNQYLQKASFNRHLSLDGNGFFRFAMNRVCPSINLRWSKLQLARGDFDLLHPTYYDLYYLQSRPRQPIVLTVYDMIHELYPERFMGDITAEKKRVAIENADAIIAISESTKNDIINIYDTDPKKITVIHLASSLASVDPDKEVMVPERYILFVGNRRSYKNFDYFIRSISPLLLRDSILKVVCAGGGVFAEDELNLIENLGVSNQVIYYPIDDGKLRTIYSKADLFVFPSLYEGFGIPMLEAFGAGCPVAASRSSSLSEVGGDAARYFDPEDSASILTTVEEIIYDRPLQLALKTKGYQRFREFSWENTAEETQKVYENLL